MTRTERDDVLRLVTHNLWVGQSNRSARRNLGRLAGDTDRPHVLALQEAHRFDGTIPGYRRIGVETKLHRDDGDCVLLVRNDLPVIRPRLVQVGDPWWTGPKHGLRHPPHVFVGATIDHGGHRWDVLSVHRCWTGRGKRNLGAWRAEHTALRRFLRERASRNRGQRPVIALGDWNAGATELEDLAQDVLKPAQLAMRGIDGALVINATAAADKLDGRYGSDGHHPVAVTVRLPR